MNTMSTRTLLRTEELAAYRRGPRPVTLATRAVLAAAILEAEESGEEYARRGTEMRFPEAVR